jgi:eukaryotic-like serine/threonine-protein kinase
MTDPHTPDGGDDEDRTVFMPGGGGAGPPGPPQGPPQGYPDRPAGHGAQSAPFGGDGEPRPYISDPYGQQQPPQQGGGHTSQPYGDPSAPGQGGGSGFTQGNFQTQFAPRADGKGIQVGDVLNHIFEVKRFIARGGMGEVFEGANVNSDERVAIKVMLPSLAADPNVIAMFRKEARTLTRLNHEGLVNYRVLAQEPQLGVLYIVTEYIDGTNLADVLGEIKPTPEQMTSMLRRLAAGLRAAHALGAIHRDMSPDNVILEEGDITKAKVIDFGIAKDLDPGSKTIVGEGFAGKLNYVAPEQLGDFGREVGPWTDVYSLALVMLAVAMGKNVQMGGSLVDAVDKRRAGPDLTPVPDVLRPVLEKMLKPNPQERLRSMDAVLDELSGRTDAGVAPPPKSNLPLILGGGAAALALAAGAWFALGRGEPQQAGGPGRPGITAAPTDPVQMAREAIDSTLPSVSCTWLNVTKVEKQGDRMLVALTGVAGNPAAAQNEVSRALGAAKIQNAEINFDEVAPITQSGCAALDTYRQIRVPDARHLSVAQRSFEMRLQPAGTAYPGENAANAIITLNVGDPKSDFTLIGLEPSGVITQLIPSREAFEATRKQNATFATDLGGDRFRLQIDLDHQGWSGLLLLTGKPPFAKATVAPDLGARGPDWRNSFVSTAANSNWQADMVWFKSVDEVKE